MKKPVFKTGKLIIVIGVAAAFGPAATAEFVVTSLDDDGAGTLREAIAQAEANPGSDKISFGVSGQITLAATLPSINDDLTVDSSGQDVIVSGDNAVRVFIVDGGDVVMRGFSIINGEPASGSGGGIDHNAGTLTVEDMMFRGNDAVVGGGIVSSGNAEMLTVRRCTFDDNSGLQSGGVHVAGAQAVIEDSIFTNNVAVFQGPAAAGFGGAMAIFGSTSVQIRNTIYDGNVSQRNAGAVGVVNSTVSFTDVEVLNSRGEQDSGALSFTAGSNATFIRCIIAGNTNVENGGAMLVQDIGTRVTILDSTIEGNESSGGGGAITVPAGTLIVSGSTFFDNHAESDGGAINVTRNGGRLEMSNTTVSSNTARRSGGGISLGADVTAIIESSTIAFNTAQNSGGGLNISGQVALPVELSNTIFASNSAIGNTSAPDIIGNQISSLGFNLYENAGPAINASTDLLNANADLQPLADNGGATMTHGLGGVSDAIDTGSTLLDADQRGLPRPFGVIADIGAVESTVIPDVDIANPLEAVDIFDVFAFLDILQRNDVENGDATADGELSITDLRLFLRVVIGL